jgi:hypothetical protein
MGTVAPFPNLSRFEPVPKCRLVRGAVVWAHIPFEEGEGEKTRPAVVIERRGRNVVLKPATTSSSWRRYPHRYVEIQDIGVAGLRRPTAVRSDQVIVDLIEIVDLVGRLSEEDAVAVLRDLPETAISHVG